MKSITSSLLASLLVIAGNAHATNSIVCTGKIETLAVHSTDKLIIKLEGMNAPVQGCSFGATMGVTHPVGAAQCKAAYSALLLAYTQDKTIQLYLDNVVNGTTCTNFQAWELATIRYVALYRTPL